MGLEERISQIYGVPVKLWGPYMCSDGRERIDVRTPDKPKGTTHQYARILLEVKLGRKLRDDETVDHVDGDKTNNDPANLKPMSLYENAKESARRLEPMVFICPQCGVSFQLEGVKLSNALSNRKRGKVGPFCSRSHAGLYGAMVQNNEIHRITTQTEIHPTYYTLKNKMGT